MDVLSKDMTRAVDRPIKVIQFGEGNFLRAFVDYMFDIANEKGYFNGSIVLVKPITFGNLEAFHEQDCQYTVCLRGIVDGEAKENNRIVTSVKDAVDAYTEYEKYAALATENELKFVVSNTTEAGIVFDANDSISLNPPMTFPGKLTKLLYERYTYYSGDCTKGLVMLPVELIDDNGMHLKECVKKYAELWNLGKGFEQWIEKACTFCSTLVDRIVTGYPHGEEEVFWNKFGYKDRLMVTGEPFALWVIESDKDISEDLPLVKAGLPVIYTDNQKPYKQRKVRILNGAHTSFVLASYLAGNDYVRESMEDKDIFSFMNITIFEEVIPTLSLPKEELEDFANSVIQRFQNPYVKHALLSISLNSVSKWRARCMPSLLQYVERNNTLPRHLTFSLAALIAFYHGKNIVDGALIGERANCEYKIMDDAKVLEFFASRYDVSVEQLVKDVLSNQEFWGTDLTEVKELEQTVVENLKAFQTVGMRDAIKAINE